MHSRLDFTSQNFAITGPQHPKTAPRLGPKAILTSSKDAFIKQPLSPVLFGWNADNPLDAVRKCLNGPYRHRITEQQRQEYEECLRLLENRQGRQSDVWLKSPKSNSFVNWPAEGVLDYYRQKNVPPGWVYYDTQLLKGFSMREPGLREGPVLIGTHLAPDRQQVAYSYSDEIPGLGGSQLGTRKLVRIESLSDDGRTLRESFSFDNDTSAPYELYLKLNFSFDDILKVRSDDTPVPPQPIRWRADDTQQIIVGYRNVSDLDAPGQRNFLYLDFPTPNQDKPDVWHKLMTTQGIPGEAALIRLTIPPGKSNWSFTLFTNMRRETTHYDRTIGQPNNAPPNSAFQLPKIRVSSNTGGSKISKLFETAGQDLQTLTLSIDNVNKTETFFPPGAGIPNYVALFGRDSLITALFLLEFQPEYARQTLLALASYQGTRNNNETMEEPGKIMHELRYGPSTAAGLTPHSPYYGSLDATPLFIILFKAYLDRTGDVELAQKLRPNVLAAMACIHRNMNKRGYLIQHYRKQNAEGTGGLKNIGWRDNNDAMRLLLDRTKNKFVEPKYPLAPAEVQAYLYQAYQSAIAWAQENQGASEESIRTWQQQAKQLKKNFNHDFWMPEKRWLAIALDADNQPVGAVSSNGAQALLAKGFVKPEYVREMGRRILEPDLLSGWGIRTLASSESAYNPIAYHNGTVWSHDNGMIALAARAQGDTKLARTIAGQLLEAACHFPDFRLPELFVGLSKQEMPVPVQYPRSCVPQAWASATPYALLTSVLGISVRSENGSPSLHFQNPILPNQIDKIEILQWPLSSDKTIDIKAIRADGDRVDIYTRPTASLPWRKYIA
jgi:glycogen debranching enzyme